MPFGDINKLGTPDFITALLKGKAEIGAAPESWEGIMKIAKAENVATDEQLAKFTYRVIGRDQMKFFAHPGLKISEKLKTIDLAGIFSGKKIKNWKEVGGPDLSITKIVQQGRPATIAMLNNRILKGAKVAEDCIRTQTFTETLEKVEQIEGAISFGTSWAMDKTVATVQTVEEFGRPVTAFLIGKPSLEAQAIFKTISGLNLQ